jgi:hypothetical protein
MKTESCKKLTDRRLAPLPAWIWSFASGLEHETEFDELRLFPSVSGHDATLLE